MQVGWRRCYRLLEAGVGVSLESAKRQQRAYDVTCWVAHSQGQTFFYQLLRPTRRQSQTGFRSTDLRSFSDRLLSPTDDLGAFRCEHVARHSPSPAASES